MQIKNDIYFPKWTELMQVEMSTMEKHSVIELVKRPIK
jgi:hypothetical protein